MNKFSFVFNYTAYNPLGSVSIVYSDTVYNAMKEVIAQQNVINKANGNALITIDPDDYISSGITALVTAFNNATSGQIIVRIMQETKIFPV